MSRVADGPAILAALHDGRRRPPRTTRMTSSCTMLSKTGQVGSMLGMLGMLQAKVLARQGTGRATAASVDGQSPCAASEHALEARSTLLDQAPAFVGVKVLEFLHMHESIAFSWQQQQQTRTRDRSLRPMVPVTATGKKRVLHFSSSLCSPLFRR